MDWILRCLEAGVPLVGGHRSGGEGPWFRCWGAGGVSGVMACWWSGPPRRSTPFS